MIIKGIQIRDMSHEDVPTIAGIERSAFEDPWPEAAFHELLTVRNRRNLVAVNGDNRPLGYVCGQFVADEIQIHNIAVAPDHQRQGLGRRLLTAAEDWGRECGAFGAVLDVRATNTAALALYGRFGYRRIGRRRGYYENPRCDALILFKPLVNRAD